jgi:ABC-type antimicrobial peptide transport system permease subunit
MFAAAALALIATGLAGAAFPARRAARIDASDALRRP